MIIMKQCITVTDLNKKYIESQNNLLAEYDYQRLQAPTLADYLVANKLVYEQELERVNGRVN